MQSSNQSYRNMPAKQCTKMPKKMAKEYIDTIMHKIPEPVISTSKYEYNSDATPEQEITQLQPQLTRQKMKIPLLPSSDEISIYCCDGLMYNDLKLYQLQLWAKLRKIRSGGNKLTLFIRLYRHTILINSCTYIQKIYRGHRIRRIDKMRPGLQLSKRSCACINATDFATMQPLEELHYFSFYSFVEDGVTYGFDVMSFFNLYQSSKTSSRVKNPYRSGQFFTVESIEHFQKYMHHIFYAHGFSCFDEMLYFLTRLSDIGNVKPYKKIKLHEFAELIKSTSDNNMITLEQLNADGTAQPVDENDAASRNITIFVDTEELETMMAARDAAQRSNSTSTTPVLEPQQPVIEHPVLEPTHNGHIMEESEPEPTMQMPETEPEPEHVPEIDERTQAIFMRSYTQFGYHTDEEIAAMMQHFTQPLLDQDRELNANFVYVAQELDILGYYSLPKWWTHMTAQTMITYIHGLQQLWNTTGLNLATKRQICPYHNGVAFPRIPNVESIAELSRFQLKAYLAGILRRLLSSNEADFRTTGAIYIIGGLTLVNEDVRREFHYLYNTFWA